MPWARHGLLFRPVEREDLPLLRQHRNEAVGSFRDPMHAWPADQEAWYRSLNRESQAFLASSEVEGHAIGLLRFPTFDWINRSVGHIGCDVFQAHRGRGHGAQIMRAAAEYAFVTWGMHRIWSQTRASNQAMIRTLEKAGYVEEGRLREALWSDAGYEDFVQFSRLNPA